MVGDRAHSPVDARARVRPAGDPAPRGAARPAEVVAYVLAATAACALVAAPLLVGLVPSDLGGLLVPLCQLTPALVAILWWRATPRPRESLRRVLALRWSWPGAAVGVLAVATVSAAQLVLGLLLGWRLAPGAAIQAAALALLPVLLVQAVFAIGEELGWRGWLATRTTAWAFPVAALASALAWVFWHLPALPLVVGDGGWEVGASYLLSIASWAPFLLALRRVFGSVWAAVVAHGSLNSIRVFLLQSIPGAPDVSWPVEVLGWMLWLAAAWFLARLGSRGGRPAPR